MGVAHEINNPLNNILLLAGNGMETLMSSVSGSEKLDNIPHGRHGELSMTGAGAGPLARARRGPHHTLAHVYRI
jgi:hypothetical protein